MQAIGTRHLQSEAEFSRLVEGVQADPDYVEPEAFGLGLARVAVSGEVLDVRFPTVNRGENSGSAAVIAGATDNFQAVGSRGQLSHPVRTHNQMYGAFAPFTNDGERHSNIDAMNAVFGRPHNRHPDRYTLEPVLAVIHDLEEPPTNTVDAWFRLHLLSTRKVQPHGLNLDGVFGLMTNVSWTNEGPVLPDDVDRVRTEMLADDRDLIVRGNDKFPHMADYVRVPNGVRVADATRVRLGAHLSEGTVVMHEGFVNFNAGTLPPTSDDQPKRVMVEGRISAGVVVGNDSDIGGGASIMGTLSGGGEEVITIGERVLIGANGGTGISLGDDCVIEAGTYVTAGKKLIFEGQEVRASDLSGSSGLLFIQNSLTGAIEVTRREGKKSVLNPALHAN